MALLTKCVAKALRVGNKVLPNVRLANRLLAAPHFRKGNGRWPVKPTSIGAKLNDFVFDRMTQNKWTARQIRCVDKEFAKTEALALCSDILVPETALIISVDNNTTVRQLEKQLENFSGEKYVAKPTNGSGTTIFLDKPNFRSEVPKLLSSVKQDFFRFLRETQYASLAKKIIVEKNISQDEQAPIDYKFFCFKGNPEFCQVDVGRFENHRRAIYDLPSGLLSKLVIGKHPLIDNLKLPENFKQMQEFARVLAAPFDFVRVDLYSIDSKVYFSEFTFSPGAAMEKHQNDQNVVRLVRELVS